MRFKSRAGQIKHSIANASPTPRYRSNISWNGDVLPGHNYAEMGPQTRYTLRSNTASMTKDLII